MNKNLLKKNPKTFEGTGNEALVRLSIDFTTEEKIEVTAHFADRIESNGTVIESNWRRYDRQYSSFSDLLQAAAALGGENTGIPELVSLIWGMKQLIDSEVMS